MVQTIENLKKKIKYETALLAKGVPKSEASKMADKYYDSLPKRGFAESVGNTFSRAGQKAVDVVQKISKVAPSVIPGAGFVAAANGIFSEQATGVQIPAFVDQLGQIKVPKASAGSGMFSGLMNEATNVTDKRAQVLPGPAAQFVPGNTGVSGELNVGGIQVKIGDGDNEDPVVPQNTSSNSSGINWAGPIFWVAVLFAAWRFGLFKKLFSR